MHSKIDVSKMLKRLIIWNRWCTIHNPYPLVLLHMLMGSVNVFEGRQFPDKAIDLIDEACATARMQRDNILKGSTTHLLPENVANQAVSPGQIAEVWHLNIVRVLYYTAVSSN